MLTLNRFSLRFSLTSRCSAQLISYPQRTRHRIIHPSVILTASPAQGCFPVVLQERGWTLRHEAGGTESPVPSPCVGRWEEIQLAFAAAVLMMCESSSNYSEQIKNTRLTFQLEILKCHKIAHDPFKLCGKNFFLLVISLSAWIWKSLCNIPMMKCDLI